MLEIRTYSSKEAQTTNFPANCQFARTKAEIRNKIRIKPKIIAKPETQVSNIFSSSCKKYLFNNVPAPYGRKRIIAISTIFIRINIITCMFSPQTKKPARADANPDVTGKTPAGFINFLESFLVRILNLQYSISNYIGIYYIKTLRKVKAPGIIFL